MISGDYPTHTEALRKTARIIHGTNEGSADQIAEIYAGCLRDVKFKHACNIYLSPLGFSSDIFSSGGIPESLLESLANNVMSYSGPKTEAILVAADESGTHLYLVDKDSKVN